MLRYNEILKELKELPSDRLEELYQFVHSLNPKAKRSNETRKKILSYAGAFNDMPLKDYNAFVKETRKIRSTLFERHFTL